MVSRGMGMGPYHTRPTTGCDSRGLGCLTGGGWGAFLGGLRDEPARQSGAAPSGEQLAFSEHDCHVIGRDLNIHWVARL